MKSILTTFVIAALSLTQVCLAQWFWQNPLPQGNDLYSVSFIDSNTGWIAGIKGTIYKTTENAEMELGKPDPRDISKSFQ